MGFDSGLQIFWSVTTRIQRLCFKPSLKARSLASTCKVRPVLYSPMSYNVADKLYNPCHAHLPLSNGIKKPDIRNKVIKLAKPNRYGMWKTVFADRFRSMTLFLCRSLDSVSSIERFHAVQRVTILRNKFQAPVYSKHVLSRRSNSLILSDVTNIESTRTFTTTRDKSLPIIYLFTKDGCTLCDEAKAVLRPYNHRFNLEEVDILLPENADWYEKYKYDIPVFHMYEDFLFMHRVDLDILEQALKHHEEQNGSRE